MSYVAAFRETHLIDMSGRGHKKMITHPNLAESYFVGDDSTRPPAQDVAAPQHQQGQQGQGSPAGSSYSKSTTRHHTRRHIPGHSSIGLLSAEPLPPTTARPLVAVKSPLTASYSSNPNRQVGGETTVILGDDEGGRFVSTYGIKEEALRIAANPEMRKAVIDIPVAGSRPAVKGQRRSEFGPGGEDHNVLDQGFHKYHNESMDEAQRRSALDPAAKQEAKAMSPAGTRILRPVGLKVTRSIGGEETGKFDWPESSLNGQSSSNAHPPSLPNSSSSASTSSAQTYSVSANEASHNFHRPDPAVGGRSAPFLPRSSMAAIIQQQADVNNSRPSTASGRGKSNTSSSITEMFAHIANPVEVPQTRSPIRRAQPVGGPFFASAGGEQQFRGKAQLSHHTASNVVFG
jgi:hypothetical protein